MIQSEATAGPRLQMALIYDTAAQPPPSGVRAVVQRARRLLYTADQTELILQIAPDRRPEHVRLVGQVLDDGMPVEGAAISVRGTPSVIDCTTDEEGEFRVADLAKGLYELDVDTATYAISIDALIVA